MNKEFQAHVLNEDAKAKVNDIRQHFDVLLCNLEGYCPPGREFSIVKTKLEEACMFAVKSVAVNQKAEG